MCVLAHLLYVDTWVCFPAVSPEIKMLKVFKGDSTVVMKGEPVEIPGDVMGLPKVPIPKDDVLITESTDGLKVETVETGRVKCKTTLTIPSATRQDEVVYTITASNNMGSWARSTPASTSLCWVRESSR